VNPDTTDSSVQLRDLLSRIRRRAPIALCIAGATLAVGLGAGLATPAEYTATATLTVSPITLDPFSSSTSSQQININTEREVISSSEVARIAAEDIGDGVSPQTLLRESAVAAPSQSQVLQVSVSAADPAKAAEYANAMASAYLDFRAQGAMEVASTRIAALDERIEQLEGGSSANPVLTELRAERSALETVGSNPGRIIGFAAPPTSPSSLGLPVFLTAGLAGGILLGAALALAIDLRDRHVRFPERLSEAAGKAVYVLRHARDGEAYRWVLRAIREPFAGSRRTRPLVVALFGLPGTEHDEFGKQLMATARAAGMNVHLLRSSEFREQELDKPWKYEPAKGASINLVLIDASGITAPSRQATLADACDGAVLLARAGNELKHVRALLEHIGASRSRLGIVPVFVPRKQSTRSGALAVAARASRPSATATPVVPAGAVAMVSDR
jgi:capsular polysaccharide biosynthesis protein